jgi:serine/threonine-protein kinase HipA
MERIHFASAMTLLGHADGTDSQAGASYLEIVEFITRQGARPDADLCELWRRIIFSIAIHNTDDHLRNHGFLLTDRGWMLSPAFDLNPDPDGTGLSLNISEDDNALSLDLALEVAPMFRIDRGKADAMIRQVRKVVSKWRRHARDLGIPSAEQDRMASAFGF